MYLGELNQTLLEEEPDIESGLFNADFVPIPPDKRSWTQWNYTSIWISMSVCIPTYMLASSLIQEGMNWWQAILTIFLGNVIVLLPMVLNGIPGAKYGIPFPVLLRASFGTSGAVLAALLRAFVGCGWFGIQCWIGGSAIYQMLFTLFPSVASSTYLGDWLGLTLVQLICFLFFWVLNIWIIKKGINTIKALESWSAPLLIIMGLALVWWAMAQAGSFSEILAASLDLRDKNGGFWPVFWPGLTAIIGFWATLALNIPDFTRFAVSQKAQIRGQLWGLPTTMTLFSFIGIFVSSATLLLYGEAIWNPVNLLGKFSSPLVIIISMIGLSIATLSTNIAANVVAAANDIANIAPHKISFKMGGYITAVIGICIFPWKLLTDSHGFIFIWLIAYSALLGAVAGIMLCDYYLIRKGRLDIRELYKKKGIYKLWNQNALIALIIAILPVLPGFLVEVGISSTNSIPMSWHLIYDYAWFITFFLAFCSFWLLSQFNQKGLQTTQIAHVFSNNS